MSFSASSSSSDELLYMRGVQASQAGNFATAVVWLAQAAQAQPSRGDIAYNYGVALQKTGNLPQAIEVWEKAVTLSPEHSVIWANLALAYRLSRQEEQARQIYERGLQQHPENRDLLYPYALLLTRLGEQAQSLALFQKLTERNPADSAAWINAGKAAKELGQWQTAEKAYDTAIALGGPNEPHARFNRANLRLSLGNWEQGFADYEARRQLADAVPIPWDLPNATRALPSGSTLLLWSDQGIGDALMFLRFIPQVTALGYRPSLFVQSALKQLLTGHPFVEATYDPHDVPCQKMDAALALGSLPFFLHISPETSWEGPYISPAAPFTLPPSTDKKKIGLVWAGNPKHENDRNRSLSFAELAPLWSLSNIQWLSLQHGPQAKNIPADAPLRNMTEHLTDFSVTAAILQDLDLLITADTAMAHLAGAMGVPVWVLLPATGTDWRWGRNGETSFWYPSMRLFRQNPGESWAGPLQRIVSELKKTGF
ncbi:MAG: tetratricopeptide repeat protein [Bdellovibrionales bacterium]